MGTKPVRVQEQDYDRLRELADQYGTTPAQVVAEVLAHVDVEELVDQRNDSVIGYCPECGHEFGASAVQTGALSNSVWVQCPEAERDDGVHDYHGTKYSLDELSHD